MCNIKNIFKIKIIIILLFLPILIYGKNTEELVILHTNDTHVQKVIPAI